MKPGHIVLTGALSQGFVSRAIKYGTRLREDPVANAVAETARLALVVAAMIVAVVLGWSLLGAAAIVAVALVLGIVATWFVAAAFGPAGYSHAALVTRVELDGTIWLTEAVKRGVVEQPFHYHAHDFTVIDPQLEDHDLAQVLRFAKSVVAAKEAYGFFTFFGLFLYCVTGTRLCIQQAGTSICSGFVAEALIRGNAIFPRPPFSMMPADLARYYGSARYYGAAKDA